MIYESLNDLIMSCVKTHNVIKLNVLRLIKSEFVNFTKNGKTLNESDEIKIIQKMINQRKDSIKEYLKGNRSDLANKENAEIAILNEFMPSTPSDEEVEKYVNSTLDEMEKEAQLSMKSMKVIMNQVKAKYPLADGKKVAAIVTKRINN